VWAGPIRQTLRGGAPAGRPVTIRGGAPAGRPVIIRGGTQAGRPVIIRGGAPAGRPVTVRGGTQAGRPVTRHMVPTITQLIAVLAECTASALCKQSSHTLTYLVIRRNYLLVDWYPIDYTHSLVHSTRFSDWRMRRRTGTTLQSG
jgi:hypothetical protein